MEHVFHLEDHYRESDEGWWAEGTISGLLRRIFETVVVIIGNAVGVSLGFEVLWSVTSSSGIGMFYLMLTGVSIFTLIAVSTIQYSYATRSIMLGLFFRKYLGPWNRKALAITRFVNGVVLIPIIVFLTVLLKMPWLLGAGR